MKNVTKIGGEMAGPIWGGLEIDIGSYSLPYVARHHRVPMKFSALFYHCFTLLPSQRHIANALYALSNSYHITP